MKQCDKSITSTIQKLTTLIQSYLFTQIEHTLLAYLFTHWIILTDMFDWWYNDKDTSNNKLLWVCCSTKMYTLKILYKSNITLLAYLSILDNVIEKKCGTSKLRISTINISEKIYPINMRTTCHKTL